MNTAKLAYLEAFSAGLRRYYTVIKSTHAEPEREKGYLEGFIDAALHLKLFTTEELQELIEKVHYEIFGMDVQERINTSPRLSMSTDEWHQIPTFIRKGKELEI